MGNFEKLAESTGVNLNIFENTAMTLGDCNHKKLEARLEAKGYRLYGLGRNKYSLFLVTTSSGHYGYLDKNPSDSLKRVNYKDIMGEQITTVDFVKGILIGLCVGIFIGFIIGLLF